VAITDSCCGAFLIIESDNDGTSTSLASGRRCGVDDDDNDDDIDVVVVDN